MRNRETKSAFKEPHWCTRNKARLPSAPCLLAQYVVAVSPAHTSSLSKECSLLSQWGVSPLSHFRLVLSAYRVAMQSPPAAPIVRPVLNGRHFWRRPSGSHTRKQLAFSFSGQRRVRASTKYSCLRKTLAPVRAAFSFDFLFPADTRF